MTKAGKFLSKQAQLQPHYYSKTRQLNTQLENSVLMRKKKMYKLREKLMGAEYRAGDATLILMTLNNQTGGELSRLCQPCSPH